MHNRHAAEEVFGREFIAKKIAASQRKSSEQKRERLRTALRTMGFGSGEVDRAIASLDPTTWSAPLESLVRDALGILT